jgi:hypothetical protein
MSAWCNKCGVILSVSNSYQYQMISGKKQIKKTYMSNVCKPCKLDAAKIRYKLAKIHSRPVDSKCMCCGRIDKLHLDHCHNTEKYRGFTCKNCNVGLGHLGDSVEGLERALEYLKKANGRSDEGVAEEAVGGQRVP